MQSGSGLVRAFNRRVQFVSNFFIVFSSSRKYMINKSLQISKNLDFKNRPNQKFRTVIIALNSTVISRMCKNSGQNKTGFCKHLISYIIQTGSQLKFLFAFIIAYNRTILGMRATIKISCMTTYKRS